MPVITLSATRGDCTVSAVRLSRPDGLLIDIHISMCIIESMRYTWDEAKRQANLKRHELDFADAVRVFGGPLVLIEDDRASYGEQRMIGIGLLDCLLVLIVHVELDETIRIISMRKADSDEIDLFYKNAGYF